MSDKQQEKARENRLRRLAETRGLRLIKARRSDPRAPDFDRWMIVDPHGVTPPVGAGHHGRPAMTIDEVEAWLTAEHRHEAEALHAEALAVRWQLPQRDLRVDLAEDAYRFAVEHGHDPTRLLHPFELEAASLGVHLPRRYWELRSGQPESELAAAVASYSAAQRTVVLSAHEVTSGVIDRRQRRALIPKLTVARDAIDELLSELRATGESTTNPDGTTRHKDK